MWIVFRLTPADLLYKRERVLLTPLSTNAFACFDPLPKRIPFWIDVNIGLSPSTLSTSSQ